MSGENSDATKTKDPASNDRLERIEGGIGKILDVVEKKKQPESEVLPEPPKPDEKQKAGNDDSFEDDDEASDLDNFLFGKD